MYTPTWEATMTPRVKDDFYNVSMNDSVLDILSLVFEFKLATSSHLARIIKQKEQDTYLYLKLRRMWRSQLLESFKVYAGSRAGMPVYYMLSQKGLEVLGEQDRYSQNHLQSYPQATDLFAWNLFKHESQVVELASMEAKNASQTFNITFKGELGSGSHDSRSDHTIEVFTPDYTALYAAGERTFSIYSEFERTMKNKEAMIQKLERYVRHLTPEQRASATVRIIFQTPSMEQSFWLNMLSGNDSLLSKLRIVTTNLLLLKRSEQFFEPVYAERATVKLRNEGRLAVDMSSRIKLFSFL